MDKIALGVLADLLINLAAGWIGVAVILPIGLKELKRFKKMDWRVLTLDIFCAIFSLLASYLLRKVIWWIKREK